MKWVSVRIIVLNLGFLLFALGVIAPETHAIKKAIYPIYREGIKHEN